LACADLSLVLKVAVIMIISALTTQ